MGFTLSVNTNPFVNRFAEPEDLIATLADESAASDTSSWCTSSSIHRGRRRR